MTKPAFYLCGICGAYHAADFHGDCREDDARLMPEDIDEEHGVNGWDEVEMDVTP